MILVSDALRITFVEEFVLFLAMTITASASTIGLTMFGLSLPAILSTDQDEIPDSLLTDEYVEMVVQWKIRREERLKGRAMDRGDSSRPINHSFGLGFHFHSNDFTIQNENSEVECSVFTRT